MTTDRSNAPVALVSGAAGGIGAPTLAALARDGFATVGFDLSRPEGLCDAAVTGDLRSDADVRSAVQVARDLGTLTAVINLAGINIWQPFVDMDLDEARGIFEVNIWGTVRLLQAASGALFDADGAAVVTATSINGQLGIAQGSAYGMSKAALGALTRTLAVEWAPRGVRVNAVAPAMVPTGMNEVARQQPGFIEQKTRNIPLGRLIEAEEVAAAIAFLAGPASSGITGTTLYVDGGATIFGE